MHYVEVIYFTDRNQYSHSKRKECPALQADSLFNLAVEKMKKENKSVLICLRDENHQLLKNERLI